MTTMNPSGPAANPESDPLAGVPGEDEIRILNGQVQANLNALGHNSTSYLTSDTPADPNIDKPRQDMVTAHFAARQDNDSGILTDTTPPDEADPEVIKIVGRLSKTARALLAQSELTRKQPSSSDDSEPDPVGILREEAVEKYFGTHLPLRRAELMEVVYEASIRVMGRREAEAQRKSKYDSLTGLLNREGFEYAYHKKREAAKRANIPFALLRIDVDNFKPVNDIFGHRVGDRLLQHVANVLWAVEREPERDTLARIESENPADAARDGGDEFATLVDLTTHEQDEAHRQRRGPTQQLGGLCQRLLEHWHTYAQITPEIQEIMRAIPGLNISIGAVVVWPDESYSFEEYQEMADAAMYAHKRSKGVER